MSEIGRALHSEYVVAADRSGMKTFVWVLIVAATCPGCARPPATASSVALTPVSAPLTTDMAGRTSNIARLGVFRIQCLASQTEGTGFLHTSGWVITAAHVVAGCPVASIRIVTTSLPYSVIDVHDNAFADLAAVKPATRVNGTALEIAPPTFELPLGSQVVTWGFPSGYTGAAPLLSVGYVSGYERVSFKAPSSTKQYVINAPFNLGNSGGPLLSVETGQVIGVVSNKLDPMPKNISDLIAVMKSSKGLYQYKRQFPDGREEQLSEGAVVAEVLEWFRRQNQVVVGRAAMLADLREFLDSARLGP
jgi:S1-C subfamily serine protease